MKKMEERVSSTKKRLIAFAARKCETALHSRLAIVVIADEHCPMKTLPSMLDLIASHFHNDEWLSTEDALEADGNLHFPAISSARALPVCFLDLRTCCLHSYFLLSTLLLPVSSLSLSSLFFFVRDCLCPLASVKEVFQTV